VRSTFSKFITDKNLSRVFIVFLLGNKNGFFNPWSPTGKARGTYFTPRWGDIPAKGWRIHPRPKAVAFCCRGKKLLALD
jgi:hypothetical protein